MTYRVNFLRSKYSVQHPGLKHFSLCSSFSVIDQIQYLYKTTGKFIVVYILSFTIQIADSIVYAKKISELDNHSIYNFIFLFLFCCVNAQVQYILQHTMDQLVYFSHVIVTETLFLCMTVTSVFPYSLFLCLIMSVHLFCVPGMGALEYIKITVAHTKLTVVLF